MSVVSTIPVVSVFLFNSVILVILAVRPPQVSWLHVHVLPVTQAGLVIPAILAIPVVLVILVMSVVLVILLVLVVQVVLVVFGDPIEQSHSIHPS